MVGQAISTALLSQLECPEDFPCDLDFFGVESREADPIVSPSSASSGTQTDRALQRTGPFGAGLGDAEMDREA